MCHEHELVNKKNTKITLYFIDFIIACIVGIASFIVVGQILPDVESWVVYGAASIMFAVFLGIFVTMTTRQLKLIFNEK